MLDCFQAEHYFGTQAKSLTPKQQLDKFLAKYDREVVSTARGALAILRKRLPGAMELVYDNYNALAIGFGPSERASEVICSIALYPRYVNLFFLQGAKLPDPHKRLKGSGNIVRHIRLDSLSVLKDPEIVELMDEAVRRAKVPIGPKQKRKMVVRAVSAKQRPRKPAKND